MTLQSRRFTCFLMVLLLSYRTSALVFQRMPPIENELGCSPTLSRITGEENFFFDPLSLASDESFARYREAELKHGRVAMLATIGMIVPGILGKSNQVTLDILKKLTLAQYGQCLVTCAFLEAFVFCQQDSKDMPGDYATGYFGLRDKGKHERSLVAELENGRLAMLAFVVQIVSEIVTKKTVVEQWEALIMSAKKSAGM